MDKFLEGFFDAVEFEMENIMEEKGCEFDHWVDEVRGQLEDGEFDNDTQTEMYEKLIKEFKEWF